MSSFLDILLNDESSYVREAVARQKYRLDVLMYDDDENVRAVVAELGYGLDALINDKSEFVRLTAQKRLKSICARRGWTDCDRNGFCSYGERKEVKNAIS